MANKIAFINAVKGQAIEEMNNHSILASLTIAQAILESGWGESTLSKNANNLFGIKRGTWQGDFVTMPTTEYFNGMRIQVNADFRKYASWAESISDHTKVLLQDRYKNLIGETDYKKACYAVSKDGYATDLNYPKLLIELIEENRLDQYDINLKIERLMKEMDIKQLQRWLNQNGFTDENGNALVVDGIEGNHTKRAKEKAKSILSYILA